MKVIIYRVHYKTDWIEDERTHSMVPKEKVLESDFLNGEICSPAEAWEWRSTFSTVCECVKTDRVSNLLKSSEITDEFRNIGFKSFVTENKPEVILGAYEASLEYFNNFKQIKELRQNSIALLGIPGSGKTHLLTAIANNLIQKSSVPVLYFPFVEGFDDLKDDFALLEKKLEKMKRVDVLFIDDLFKPALGEPRASKWSIEKMYAVINYRYLNKKPILISSELTIDQLVNIDAALGSRIYEMCEDYTVHILGEMMELNYRLKSLKER